MPPTQEKPTIYWNEVTWYSKSLAIVLFVVFVCAAFMFGIWYQKQISTHVENDLPPQTSITTQANSISYPVGFNQALMSVSTAGWKTYTSKSGWHIQYPGTWSTADCGTEVQFASNASSVTCDAPTEQVFSVTGPLSQAEAMYSAQEARIAQSINLNGLPATRYVDALTGQTGNDFSELVVVAHGGQYFTLNFGKSLEYDLVAEKMLGTFTFVQ